MADVKNINSDRDMDMLQKRKVTSTTATFWIMNIIVMPVSISIIINLMFIVFSFRVRPSLTSGPRVVTLSATGLRSDRKGTVETGLLFFGIFYGVLYFITRLFDLLSGFFYRLIDFLAGFLDRTLFRAAG